MKISNLFKAIIVSIFFITTLAINAQNMNNSYAGNNLFALYQDSAKGNSDCMNIKFNLKEDCYAIVYVIDPVTFEKIMLVDGDISAGLHGVMFKTVADDTKTYKCILEAYDANSGNLLYTTETKLSLN